MKNSLLLLALSSLPLLAQTGGDPTTPPTTVGPVMKTLDQVEARTPLVDGAPGVTVASQPNGTITISAPGSYYLTENLTFDSNTIDAIVINSDNVTLDLNGLSITQNGPAGSGAINSAVHINGNNVCVTNGNISATLPTQTATSYTGNGFKNGIRAIFTKENISVHHVSINGCTSYSISLPQTSSRVTNCLTTKAGAGIFAGFVDSCIARDCIDRAIDASVVVNSEGHSINGDGIFCGIARNSIGRTSGSNATIGIHARIGYASSPSVTTFRNGLIVGCQGSSNAGTGLQGGIIRDSIGTTNSGANSIFCDIANSCQGIGGPVIATHKYNMP